MSLRSFMTKPRPRNKTIAMAIGAFMMCTGALFLLDDGAASGAGAAVLIVLGLVCVTAGAVLSESALQWVFVVALLINIGGGLVSFVSSLRSCEGCGLPQGGSSMSILSAALVAGASLAAGAVVGIVFGFSLASHADVLRGVRPDTTNRLILFLARPTNQMGFVGSIAFLLLMLLWLGVFLLLCGVPAIVSARLAGDDPPLMLLGYACFALAAWLSGRFGRHLWKAMT